VFPWRLMQVYRTIKKEDGEKKEVLNDSRGA
jgi:hypothetical protein